MAASTGRVGLGVEFHVGDGASPEVFTKLANVGSIDGPEAMLEFVDKTHLDSPDNYREKEPHLKNVENLTLTLHFDPASTGQSAILTDFEARSLKNFRIQLGRAGGLAVADTAWNKRFAFSGYYSRVGHAFRVDEIIARTVEITVTGALVLENNP